jgi:gamma-glutamyl:cysteine ligase YbdK (ATP-grasp superfamily)
MSDPQVGGAALIHGNPSPTPLDASGGKPALRLFEGYGVELEYMLVDVQTLDVRPLADRLLEAAAGRITGDYEAGGASWSNELAAHVVEIKTSGPVARLDGVPALLQAQVSRIDELLVPMGARLLPTAMHPWMDPSSETRLWPHEYGEVYAHFDRIFGCRRHGWANLQSVHLNLPFSGDEEFGRLHAAIRLVLPILPALAASSPLREGRTTGQLDTRLDAYRWHTWQTPSLVAQVIPEQVWSEAQYHREIYARLYADIAPHDPEERLRQPWLNARGAIARFDRGTIEIRVLDVQECPAADLAICWLTAAVVRALVEERWAPFEVQQSWPVQPLFELLLETARRADQAVIREPEYLELFGAGRSERSIAAGELWRHLYLQLAESDAAAPGWAREALGVILKRGPLARRILGSLDEGVSRARQRGVYRELADCLAQGRLFEG